MTRLLASPCISVPQDRTLTSANTDIVRCLMSYGVHVHHYWHRVNNACRQVLIILKSVRIQMSVAVHTTACIRGT